jgi:hypothetical protein
MCISEGARGGTGEERGGEDRGGEERGGEKGREKREREKREGERRDRRGERERVARCVSLAKKLYSLTLFECNSYYCFGQFPHLIRR